MMQATGERISELRRMQELLGDLLLFDHGISASPRLYASHFFINDQFYQWLQLLISPLPQISPLPKTVSLSVSFNL